MILEPGRKFACGDDAREDLAHLTKDAVEFGVESVSVERARGLEHDLPVPALQTQQEIARIRELPLGCKPPRLEQLVGHVRKRTDHDDWLLCQTLPDDLRRAPDGRRIFKRRAAELQDD